MDHHGFLFLPFLWLGTLLGPGGQQEGGSDPQHKQQFDGAKGNGSRVCVRDRLVWLLAWLPWGSAGSSLLSCTLQLHQEAIPPF